MKTVDFIPGIFILVVIMIIAHEQAPLKAPMASSTDSEPPPVAVLSEGRMRVKLPFIYTNYTKFPKT